MSDAQVTVVGGGISGLACAYRLRQLGLAVTLLEAHDRVGGLVGSVERDGFLFDFGPQSFQGTDALLGLIGELGLEGELLRADPAAPRFVLLHGQLREVPMSPQAVLTSSLLGAGTRLKILAEAFRRTQPPEEDESIASFVRRKFGQEILEYLVAPFVSGVYAGDPEKLSLRAAFPSIDEWERRYGSVLRGAMKSRPKNRTRPPPLCSFRRGMRTLAEAFARNLGDSVKTSSRVVAIRLPERGVGGEYHLRVVRAAREADISSAAIVLAVPADVAAQLIGPLSSVLSHALSGIAYAPVAVVAAGYYGKQIGHPLRGFGFLVPRREKLHTLGTVWNSSLFVGRAGEGRRTLTSFAGGATNAQMVSRTDDEIAQIVQDENARVLQIAGPPIASAVWRYARALPQYNLGHGRVVGQIRARAREIRGLFLTGNYLEGPSLGKCVENGYATAEAVRDSLQACN